MVNAYFNPKKLKQPLPRTRRKTVHFKQCLSAGLLLWSLFVLPSPAWARRYQPPKGDPPKGKFGSNGSRGCSSASFPSKQLARPMATEKTKVEQQPSVPVTLLAPLGHVGRTHSLTPTFTWFVSATDPYRVIISLFTVDADQNSELIHELEYVEMSTGLVQYTLPEGKSSLQAGQRYFVQLSVACKPDSVKFNPPFVAVIDVELPSSALEQALSKVNTPQQKAELLAQSGYWFDAVRELLLEAQDTQSYRQLRTLLKELSESEEDEGHRQALVDIADQLDDATLGLPTPSLPLERSPSAN